jgi:hypothetical protein
MAAKKKTLQELRKEYVQAKIATNSSAKNPAKLRQDFNTKAATVKGRTEIVQVLGVAGTPQAQILRATLRNFPTASTGTASTGTASTGNKKTVAGYVPGYKGVVNNPNLPSNNVASSAVVSSTSKYGVDITPIKGKVSESIGIVGKKYDTSGQKTTVIPQGKTPVVTDLGGSLRGMQGPSGFDPSKKNVARAVLATAGVAAIQSAVPVIARIKAAEAAKTLAKFDYYGSAAGTSRVPTPSSLIKQNQKELTKRAFNFYKNLTK